LLVRKAWIVFPGVDEAEPGFEKAAHMSAHQEPPHRVQAGFLLEALHQTGEGWFESGTAKIRQAGTALRASAKPRTIQAEQGVSHRQMKMG
jgi:hypothetical protein